MKNSSDTSWHRTSDLPKLVHLVGFIIRIYHDAPSPERQFRRHVTTGLCNAVKCDLFKLYISVCLFAADRQQTSLQTFADTRTSYTASTRTMPSSQKRVQCLTTFGRCRVTLSNSFVFSQYLLQTVFLRPDWLTQLVQYVWKFTGGGKRKTWTVMWKGEGIYGTSFSSLSATNNQ